MTMVIITGILNAASVNNSLKVACEKHTSPEAQYNQNLEDTIPIRLHSFLTLYVNTVLSCLRVYRSWLFYSQSHIQQMSTTSLALQVLYQKMA